MNLIKLCYLFFIIIFTSLCTSAQSGKIIEDYKIFHSIGFSTFLDLIQTPVESVSVQNGFLPDQITPRMVNSFAQSQAHAFGTLIYDIRLNIKEISEDFAFSIGLTPAVGLSFVEPVNGLNGSYGLGHIQIAGMSRINFGQMATTRSKINRGFSCGTGFEFNKIGMINSQTISQIKNWWFMPNISIGVNTYRHQSPIELNIKIGLGSKDYYNLDNLGGNISQKMSRAYSFRFAIFYKL